MSFALFRFCWSSHFFNELAYAYISGTGPDASGAAHAAWGAIASDIDVQLMLKESADMVFVQGQRRIIPRHPGKPSIRTAVAIPQAHPFAVA